LPFARATEFLSELLPLSAETSVNTVRNRTMKVGKRLRKSASVLANRSVSSSCEEAVLGLDGGYVRDRHRRPERNFEIVAGKVLDEHGAATRFAFVRQGGPDAASAAGLALRRHGITENTSLTVSHRWRRRLARHSSPTGSARRGCAGLGFISACDFRISSRWQKASQV
jgi:hypothetical protein